MKEGKKDLTSCDIRHISQDKKGNIWLATDNEGIIRISGNARNPKSLKYKQYNPDHHNFAIDDAIIVVGYPDFSIASLDNIRDTCGEDS